MSAILAQAPIPAPFFRGPGPPNDTGNTPRASGWLLGANTVIGRCAPPYPRSPGGTDLHDRAVPPLAFTGGYEWLSGSVRSRCGPLSGERGPPLFIGPGAGSGRAGLRLAGDAVGQLGVPALLAILSNVIVQSAAATETGSHRASPL